MKPTTLAALSVMAVLSLSGCGGSDSGAAAARPAAPPRQGFEIDPVSLAAFMQAPADYAIPGAPISAAQVGLGRQLYFDARLSRSRKVSCHTCHPLDRVGADGLPTSSGHRDQHGTRNAPTTFDAAGQFVQFWDGRAKDVEEQAKGQILNPVEMAHASAEACVACVASVPGYVEAFKQAFPGEAAPITFDTIARAIGAFERKLATRSRFDAYLGGDRDAITEEEKRGAVLFVKTGCFTCHAGPLVGGQLYKIAGLVRAWPSEKDLGRFEITKDPADRMAFKVPSLRNVTRTGPYFHDGSVRTIEKAVRMMADHQLGKELTVDEVARIVGFLKTLEGDPPGEMLAVPALPPDGPTTPKADEG